MNNKKTTTQLFESPLLERLSRSNSLVLVTVFLIYASLIFLYGVFYTDISTVTEVEIYFAGFVLFTFTEYLIHRFLFHYGEYLKEENWWFKIHGVHHAYPRDRDRFALPLPAATVLASILFLINWAIMGSYALFFFPGYITGYAYYHFIHFIIHTRRPPKNIFRVLWKHHYIHHYKENNKAFGLTSPFWDFVFGTMPSKKSS